MKRLSTILSVVVVSLLFTACNNGKSLQSYIVEKQEDNVFTYVDIPVNLVKEKDSVIPADVKETLQSVKKINLLGFPYKAEYKEKIVTEKEAINTILKNSKKYKTLVRANVNGVKVNLYYSGTEEAIDEVVAFGYSDTKGLGVARILGDNINPSQVLKAMKYVERGDIDFSAITSVIN